jgi:hypothetical protein
MLILLWGVLNEAPMAAVVEALHKAGADPALLDQREILKSKIAIEVNSELTGWVSSPAGLIDLTEVRSAYIRPYESCVLPAVARSKSLSARAQAAAFDELLLGWSDITSALVLNRPRHSISNNSKPYQSQLIRKAGFSVPETLITTCPEAVEEFRSRHRRVIYKSLSGIRSRVAELTDDHRQRLGNVRFCPTQFQRRIEGRDYRVHVVGQEVFVRELICDAQDYRYPGREPLEIRSAELPAAVQERCVLLTQSLGLGLAGIDLRRTPQGEWYCFEVNPSPAFTFYENSMEQPIAAAIAALLMSDIRWLAFPTHQENAGVADAGTDSTIEAGSYA